MPRGSLYGLMKKHRLSSADFRDGAPDGPRAAPGLEAGGKGPDAPPGGPAVRA